jgi:hypothetical protein
MATLSLTSARWSPERIFYLGMTLAIALAVYVGFARSFFLRPLFPAWPSPAEPILYVHGAVFSGWCVLLVVQSALVTAGRTPLHRRLGVWGAGLAASMVALGTHAALVAARRDSGFVGIPVPPLQFLVVPIFDMLLFASFVTLAVVRRRDAQAHKRLMLLATLNLITAAIARWPGVIGVGSPLLFFFLSDLFLVPLVLWDRSTRGRLHPATPIQRMRATQKIAVRFIKVGTGVPLSARAFAYLGAIPPSSTYTGHQPWGFAVLVAFLMMVIFMSESPGMRRRAVVPAK